MIQRSFVIRTEKGPVCIKRINKREARNRFNKCEDIYISPCKFNPELTYSTISRLSSGNFDTVVNTFEYYNCNNNETGTYASFYVADN